MTKEALRFVLYVGVMVLRITLLPTQLLWSIHLLHRRSWWPWCTLEPLSKGGRVRRRKALKAMHNLKSLSLSRGPLDNNVCGFLKLPMLLLSKRQAPLRDRATKPYRSISHTYFVVHPLDVRSSKLASLWVHPSLVENVMAKKNLSCYPIAILWTTMLCSR